MQKTSILGLVFSISTLAYGNLFSQNIAVGTSPPDVSAMLDVQSTTKGMLIPRMSTAQRNSIASPATGLVVFDYTTGSFWFKSSGNWIELVDNLNNVWKKSANHAVLNVTGNVGIGTITPNYALHLYRDNPQIGFYDDGDLHFSGSIQGDSSNLKINAYRKSFSGSNAPGNLILQKGGGSPNTAGAGYVGIGTSQPQAKLHVNGNQSINGDFILQSNNADKGFINVTGNNMMVATGNYNPTGKLQLRTGGASRLIINPDGDIQIGNQFSIDTTGQLRRPLITGTARLLPICYGKVAYNGTILGGTGNFTVSKTGTGEYHVTLSGEYATPPEDYVIFCTAQDDFRPHILSNIENGQIVFYTTEFKATWNNLSCRCSALGAPRVFSDFLSIPRYLRADKDFNFVVFKL